METNILKCAIFKANSINNRWHSFQCHPHAYSRRRLNWIPNYSPESFFLCRIHRDIIIACWSLFLDNFKFQFQKSHQVAIIIIKAITTFQKSNNKINEKQKHRKNEQNIFLFRELTYLKTVWVRQMIRNNLYIHHISNGTIFKYIYTHRTYSTWLVCNRKWTKAYLLNLMVHSNATHRIQPNLKSHSNDLL